MGSGERLQPEGSARGSVHPLRPLARQPADGQTPPREALMDARLHLGKPGLEVEGVWFPKTRVAIAKPLPIITNQWVMHPGWAWATPMCLVSGCLVFDYYHLDSVHTANAQ